MQTVATIVLWAGTLALLAHSARMAKQERSPLPFITQRLAVLEGTMPAPAAMTRTEKAAAAVL